METNLFRIGGVYRQGNGSVRKLIPCEFRKEWAFAAMPTLDGGFTATGWQSDGARRLSDGRYVHDLNNSRDAIALIPGELTLVDGKWIARGVEEKRDDEGIRQFQCDRIEAAKQHDAEQAALDRICADRLGQDANAAMIARDGPAKPAAVLASEPTKSTALPALSGLTKSPDQRSPIGDHLGWNWVR